MSKLTAWYPPDVKPVRVGEYSASMSKDPPLKRWWDGRLWSKYYFNYESVEEIEHCRSQFSPFQFYPWRGLASDPAEEK